jgi:hypothetical protein
MIFALLKPLYLDVVLLVAVYGVDGLAIMLVRIEVSLT